MEGSRLLQSALFNWQIVLPGFFLYIAIQYVVFKGFLWKQKRLPPGVHGCPGLGILPELAFGKKKLRELLMVYESLHGEIFRLSMGLQEIYMLQGAGAVRNALKDPYLTGWPVAARRSLSGNPIDWTRVQDDIRALLEKGDPCSRFRFGEDELDTCASFDGDAKYLRKTNSTILQCCTSMKAGIADRFELLTHDIGQLVMPEVDEQKVRDKTSESRRFNDDIAEDAALSFFPQGRPEKVLTVIKERMTPDFRKQIRRELDALPSQPYWKDSHRMPTLMRLISDAFLEAHRDFYLIRRCTRDSKLLGYDIPKDAVLVFNLRAIPTGKNSEEENDLMGWPFELGDRISPFEMAALLQIFYATIAFVRTER
ncbi:uncharacterized protein LOC100908789 [Galendromus occidentalis]|uniref:Uncharacterized protein LOC100908789 n=1 Tax=Galendromus occidentalis TaxID=34638 RepID=A0AAJ6QTS9_9ACAR|nr:uncharacterized protein LOC100908789 [Galendromus occidentalis]